MTIKRQVFYSFHYAPDNWRASQVRNIRVIEGNNPVSDNDWETVKRGGDFAIKRWINDQIKYRSCTVVLVGSNTANRKWINYEIIRSWDEGKGVVGIHIHGLKNRNGHTSRIGENPFNFIWYGNSGKRLSSIVNCYDPQGFSSKGVYSWIERNLSYVVEESIQIRNRN